MCANRTHWVWLFHPIPKIPAVREKKGLKGEGHHFKCKNEASGKRSLEKVYELTFSYQGYTSGNGQLLVADNLVITNYLGVKMRLLSV